VNRIARRALAALRAAALVVAVMALLVGCGVQIPVDPDGSLERITSEGVLRAGASPAGAALEIDGGQVSGPLAEQIEGFAQSLDARVEWTVASEEMLVDALESGDLDVAVGGMTDRTLWADRVSVTRSYPGIPGAGGRALVVFLPLGENALQAAVEEYLDSEVGG
jgi:ABC-type amino acid transport substrate-binding protein